MAPIVVLVGVPGSGKSTVGGVLARRLGVTLRDTDNDIEIAAGKRVADIFLDDGEPHFRGLEREAVAAAIAEHDGVLALGGGAVMDSGTRALLRDQATVWLQVTAAGGAKRVGFDVPRPVLLGNVRGRLATLVAERSPLYAEVATITVGTDARTPEDVADHVIEALALETAP